MRYAEPFPLELRRRVFSLGFALGQSLFVVENQIDDFQVQVKPKVISSVPPFPPLDPFLGPPCHDPGGNQAPEEHHPRHLPACRPAFAKSTSLQSPSTTCAIRSSMFLAGINFA